MYTDPVTGYYSQTLVAGIPYTFTVTAVSHGYSAGGGVVPLTPVNTPTGMVLNWTLTADPQTCNAPGYSSRDQRRLRGLLGRAPFRRAGRSSTTARAVSRPDLVGRRLHQRAVRRLHGRPDRRLGSFAVANSDCAGLGRMDTPAHHSAGRHVEPLVGDPPVRRGLPLAVRQRRRRRLDRRRRYLDERSGAQTARCTAVRGRSTSTSRRWPAASPPCRPGSTTTTRFFAWWWQVDDVLLGQALCNPLPGGLVVGNVLSTESGSGLNGATVSNTTNGGSTTTFATPDDPAQPDGLYILFSESGSNDLAGDRLRCTGPTRTRSRSFRTRRVRAGLHAGLRQRLGDPDARSMRASTRRRHARTRP